MKQRQRRSAPHPYAHLVRSIARLQLRAGDALVLTTPTADAARASRMAEELKRVIARPAMPVIVLPPGFSFSTVALPTESTAVLVEYKGASNV